MPEDITPILFTVSGILIFLGLLGWWANWKAKQETGRMFGTDFENTLSAPAPVHKPVGIRNKYRMVPKSDGRYNLEIYNRFYGVYDYEATVGDEEEGLKAIENLERETIILKNQETEPTAEPSVKDNGTDAGLIYE